MQISARNVVKGTVVTGATTAHVTIEIAPDRVVAVAKACDMMAAGN